MHDIPVIEFVRPMRGFEDHVRYALVEVEGADGLFELRSLDDADLRFVVVPPAHFFPDFAPVVGDDVVADLGITHADEVLVLVVVKVGATLDGTTANLLAPVLVNGTNRRAAQVVLDDPDLSVDTPLVA